MVRPRPELPADPEPVGNVRAETGSRKRRRKREDEAREASHQASNKEASGERSVDKSAGEVTAPEESDLDASREREVDSGPERIRREVMAEAAFRERVALAELADRLSPETYALIERALAGHSAEWRLEKGRYVFTYLVRERPVPTPAGTVTVEQKLALNREAPPVKPSRIDEAVRQAIEPGRAAPPQETVQQFEFLRKELPKGDEIRVRLANGPEVVVTAEAAVVEPQPTERGPASLPPEGTASPESVAGSEETAPADEVKRPEPGRPRLDRIVEEIDREPEETGPAPEKESVTPKAEEPVQVAIDREVPREDSSEEPELATVLELLEREAVDLNELPPIQGGAPEPGEPTPLREGDELFDVPEQPEPLTQPITEQTSEEVPFQASPVESFPDPFATRPEAPRPSRSRRCSHRRQEILRWDLDSAEVVRYPDHAMRKKARKLARRLAAEYGIKLTPQIEAYLLSIILRPHLIHGRRVYSISLNVEALISVLQVLKYNYNQTRRPST